MKLEKFILGLGTLAFLFVFTECETNDVEVGDLYSDLSAKGGKNITTTSEEETVGNNLSFPVIWSDGATKELRGDQNVDPVINGTWFGVWGEDPIDPQAPLFSCGPFSGDDLTCEDAEYKAFIQKDENNVWQAANWIPDGETTVNFIDWGDNLESIDWNLKSQVRTEVVLYKILDEPVTQYAMRHCYSWGEDEVHGLQTDLENNVITGPGDQATVFTSNARLTIQKLSINSLEELHDDEGNSKLQWRKNIGWTEIDEGDELVIDNALFNMAVHEGSDGPGFYNAEVNVKGKVIFGYTWNVRQLNEDDGYYRITFSFDDDSGIPLRTDFKTNETSILLPEEEDLEEKTTDEGSSGEAARGGEAKIDFVNNLTYMDILITPKTTGSGGGGGQGGGGH